MKYLSTILAILLLTNSSIAQNPFDEWAEESKTNKRLLPRYGHLSKSQREIESDSSFIKQIMAQSQFKTYREASNHLISLGFQYYYRPDFRTAMYRFNQAYLLDTTNTDIFWGYGAIYMGFGEYELAKKQYITGLSIDSNNTHLLTDFATYFMEQYYLMAQMPKNDLVQNSKERARSYIDSAIHYLSKSYALDPKDVNTVYKLSTSNWYIENCSEAWKYYDLAVLLGGKPVTKEYTNDLKKRCKRK